MSVLIRSAALAVVLGALSPAAPALAQQHHHSAAAGSIALSPAWTRATPPGAKVAGGFFTIENKGGAADRLVSATSEIANIVEIHEMAVIDGVMRMRALDKGLPVAAGGKMELKPGSYHIMFIDIKRPLKEGESVKGELVFEKAGKMAVEYKVMPVGAPYAPMNQHKH